jgi:Fic family protein
VKDWKNIKIELEELNEILDRLSEKKAQIDNYRPIPTIAIHSITESLTLEWTHHSSGIEGNSLTLQETKVVLGEGMTIKGKSLREHFEVVNHHEAIDFIISLAKPDYKINEADILDTHAIILEKIEKDFAGRFRNSGVRIGGTNFTPPNALKVYDMIHELMDWTNSSDDLHPIVRATIFHHRFVHINPFFDGNGRTVRLLFNLLLMKDGYPPAVILKNDRKKYYDALNKANLGDYSKLFLLISQAAERSLNIYLNALNNNDDYKPITQIVEEANVPYGIEYISLLARRGRIDAYKENGVWFTSEDAILNYRNKRKRNR